MQTLIKRWTILGAGAWGRALTYAFKNSGADVVLWGRRPDDDVILSLEKALSFSPYVVITVGAQSARSVLTEIIPFKPKWCLLAPKGIEHNTGMLLGEIIEEVIPGCGFGAIGGPNLAKEIAQGQPCGITIASSDVNMLNQLATLLRQGQFIVEALQDVTGVQVAAALKNVMAIGYGLLQQISESENLLATFIVLALHEMSLLGVGLGGQKETFLSFAGVGDLILTCNSHHSRNSEFGRLFPNTSHLGLVEGAQTIKGVLKRAQTLNLSLPIIQGISDIIRGVLPLRRLLEHIPLSGHFSSL